MTEPKDIGYAFTSVDVPSSAYSSLSELGYLPIHPRAITVGIEFLKHPRLARQQKFYYREGNVTETVYEAEETTTVPIHCPFSTHLKFSDGSRGFINVILDETISLPEWFISNPEYAAAYDAARSKIRTAPTQTIKYPEFELPEISKVPAPAWLDRVFTNWKEVFRLQAPDTEVPLKARFAQLVPILTQALIQNSIIYEQPMHYGARTETGQILPVYQRYVSAEHPESTPLPVWINRAIPAEKFWKSVIEQTVRTANEDKVL